MSQTDGAARSVQPRFSRGGDAPSMLIHFESSPTIEIIKPGEPT
jgi:hypothetical protein